MEDIIMATHTELESIPMQGGRYRFCLDRVIRDDADNRIEYSFVWRGTAKSPDGFIPRQAYFEFNLLGQLLHQAIVNGSISEGDASEFLLTLISG